MGSGGLLVIVSNAVPGAIPKQVKAQKRQEETRSEHDPEMLLSSKGKAAQWSGKMDF